MRRQRYETLAYKQNADAEAVRETFSYREHKAQRWKLSLSANG